MYMDPVAVPRRTIRYPRYELVGDIPVPQIDDLNSIAYSTPEPND